MVGGDGLAGPGQEADCLQCTCLKRPPRRQVFNTSAKIKESSAYTQYPTVSELKKCQKFIAFWGVILCRIQSFLSPGQV